MNHKTLLLAGGALAAYLVWKNTQAAAASTNATTTSVAPAPLMAAAITAAAAFAAYHYGNGEIKTAALGVLGVMALNQIPVIRDGVDVRLVA